ncbi:MAG: adenosine deaminase [Chloroflexi bacterium]|nr:adenosine deaminase [Chloroflexota bacterium]
MLSHQTLAALPKIELHRHLEGSLRLTTLFELAREFKLDLPTDDIDALRAYVQITDEGGDFRTFLSKFVVLRQFYKSREVIERFAYEAVADAAADNIRYFEMRFTPMALAKAQGFALEDVTDWVIGAVEKAQRTFPIAVQLIASMNRNEDVSIGERVVQVAIANRHRGVVAVDLAGDEANFPAAPFAPQFERAAAAGLGVTIHAGEWSGPDNVRQAIELFHAARIGHGVRVVEDPAVLLLARDRGVTFEVCVTSNVQSGVVQRFVDHPLKTMLEQNLRATLNTDDPSVSDITLADEMHIVGGSLGLGLDDLKRMTLTAAEASFLPEAERRKLVTQFKTELARVE